MSISGPEEPRAIKVELGAGELVVHLEDGRSVHVPLDWFPKLAGANARDLSDWRLVGHGIGIHWPTLDEDLSVRALLAPKRVTQRRSG